MSQASKVISPQVSVRRSDSNMLNLPTKHFPSYKSRRMLCPPRAHVQNKEPGAIVLTSSPALIMKQEEHDRRWRSSIAILVYARCMFTVAHAECPAYLQGGPDKLPTCDFEQQNYLIGRWELMPRDCWPANNEELANFSYAHTIMRTCNPKIHMCEVGGNACPYKTPLFSRWRWRTQQCKLKTFNAATLSQSMADKRVQFIGDSLMVEQFNSLKALLQSQNLQEPEWGWFTTGHGANFRVYGTWHLVGNGSEGSPSSLEHIFDVNHGGWRTVLPDADVLVLNTGHHWHRVDPDFSAYRIMVKNALQLIAREFRGSHVIFRTSTWGHYHCSGVSSPLQEVIHADEDHFNWRKPISAETVWSDLASTYLPAHVQFHVINASITMLRADAHVGRLVSSDHRSVEDCLHNCLPGPADYWNWLLYNTLVA
ncbi:TPA: hypothetical protein ACH3X2_010548 [Trebouxia sp. C0005]